MLQIHRSVLLWGHFRADSDHNKKADNDSHYEAKPTFNISSSRKSDE